MLTGREQETAFLENHYKRPGSQILVVYGQRGVGKTALLTVFTEEKQTCYTSKDYDALQTALKSIRTEPDEMIIYDRKTVIRG